MTARVRVTTIPGLSPAAPVSRIEVSVIGERILDTLGLPDAVVDLHIVDDGEMAVLHRQFMDRNGPTNVLSFPDEDPENPDYAGQVILSVDTLMREAELYGQCLRAHLIRLLAHAFLHLAGLDHGPEMDALTEHAVDTLA